jgi:4-amino-4-deoxy-L-arabinose transferase-like glycosyltransferase
MRGAAVDEPPPVEIDSADCMPRSLPACLPFIWSRILFPGTAPEPTPLRWTTVLLVVFLPAALLYPCITFPLFEPDEGRYAEIPREMLERGEVVVPYLQGEPYLDKPPLMYWLSMGCYRLFGVHDWAARLPAALAIHGCVLLIYLLGRRSLGERAARWGALVLCLAPGFMTIGRLLVLDGVLAWWVTLSVLSAFEAIRGTSLGWGWWLLSAAACGLGVLTKGPVALILLLPPLWAYGRLARPSCVVSGRAWLAFFGTVLVVALPWYAAICVRLPEFASYFLWDHNVVRFLAPFDHLEPIWYYAPILLIGLLPATLLLVPFIRYLLAADPKTAAGRCPELGFMLLAGGWCVLFFSLSGCKLPTYILPAFPMLALALGYFVAASRWQTFPWLRSAAAIAIMFMAAAQHLAVPWYAAYRSPGARLEDVSRYFADRDIPVICFPRPCDSLGFYLNRDDLRSFRSKQIDALRAALREHPRTVVVCTHRHSLNGLRQALPPELRLCDETHVGLAGIRGVPDWLMEKIIRLAGETPLGLCDVAIVERR